MTALIPCKRYGATTIIFVAFVFICLLLFVLKGRIFLMKQHYDNDNNNNDENTNYMTAIQDQMKHFSSDLPTIILQDGNWEEDYILYDLMSAVPTCYDSWKERKFCFGVNGSKVFDLQTTMKDFKTYNLLRLSGKQISNIHLYQQLFPTPSSSQNKYILVFSSNQSRKDRSQRSLLDELLKVAKYLQPRVIIQLSDEKGDKPEYMQLAAVCNLYLRQYYHAHYPVHTAWDARTVHIPLGYTLGMFEKKSSLSDAVMNVSSIAKSYLESITNKIRDRNSNRHLVWTFIGNQKKKDRPEMIRELKLLPGPHFLGDANISARDMAATLRHTLFAPGGRGHAVLDTTRLLDASACGAIPVVVGSDSELANTFKHYHNPPWLLSQSWSHARQEMQKLLAMPPQVLIDRRNKVLLWWRDIVLSIRHNISDALK